MSSDNSDKKVIPFANGLHEVSNPPANDDSSEQQEDAVCQFCFGTGTRLDSGKGAAICDCQRSNSGARALDAARIPKHFRRSSLQNFNSNNNSQENAVRFAWELVQNYPGVDRGLLLIGGVGVGKTHLAIAIIRSLIATKGVKCLFYESGSLLKAIQESYNSISQTSEMRVLAPVFEAEVLVLDELGATVPTDWVRDTLYQIINTRYNNEKLTIFTTNFFDSIKVERNETRPPTAKDFTDEAVVSSGQYQEGKPPERQTSYVKSYTLEERIGTRLRSRLYEMCREVIIEGGDYRRQLHQPRFDSPAN